MRWLHPDAKGYVTATESVWRDRDGNDAAACAGDEYPMSGHEYRTQQQSC